MFFIYGIPKDCDEEHFKTVSLTVGSYNTPDSGTTWPEIADGVQILIANFY